MATEKTRNPHSSRPAKRWVSHTEYAEDQPLSRLILAGHVLHRGFQTGVFVGTFITLARASVSVALGNTSIPVLQHTFLPQLQRTVGLVGLCSCGALGLALTGKMLNAEEIEWKDRAWRLLENEGQVESDHWAVVGSLLGLSALGFAATQGRFPVDALSHSVTPTLRIVGAAGLGNLGGVIGYLVWKKTARGNQKD